MLCYTRNFFDATGRKRIDISPSEFRALGSSERGQALLGWADPQPPG
jgi:hypothetical protein